MCLSRTSAKKSTSLIWFAFVAIRFIQHSQHQQYHHSSACYCMITVSLFIPLPCRFFAFAFFVARCFACATAMIRACSTLSCNTMHGHSVAWMSIYCSTSACARNRQCTALEQDFVLWLASQWLWRNQQRVHAQSHERSSTNSSRKSTNSSIRTCVS